jgi:hypothetical protein
MMSGSVSLKFNEFGRGCMEDAQSPPAALRLRNWWGLAFTVTLIFTILPASPLPAQELPKHAPPAPPTSAQPTRITPAQAKELFGSIDAILQFDSRNTGLPILRSVKRQLVTRDEVEHYLIQQLHNDRDAKRLQRSELVLKKFGLLDRDFQLQPFLIQLLREQIAGYYNDKTDTVNLLDWIPPDEQKPVLAHELTHALQDQHVRLDKWDQMSDLPVAKNVQQDNQHIASDEEDTVRNAVIEGQAMAVFIDYTLAPTGKNILTAPGLADKINEAMSDNADSPTLANAPLLLQRSLLFPYVAGLNFVRSVLAAKGKQAAFSGMLDHPPSSTYEIMTPKIYLDHRPVPLLKMPDIHPLIDSQYRPYDIGAIGEFDVQLMAELFGGPAAAKSLAPAWRGGVYYAAQNKIARTDAAQDSTNSLALLYLSEWATPKAARAFAAVYAREIPRKYDNVDVQPDDGENGSETGIFNQIWNTSEGPVLIGVSGRTVFISESFPLQLARKLQFVMMGSVADSSGSLLVQSVSGRLAPVKSDTPRVELTAVLRHSLFTAGLCSIMPRYTNHFAGSSRSRNQNFSTSFRPNLRRPADSVH